MAAPGQCQCLQGWVRRIPGSDVCSSRRCWMRRSRRQRRTAAGGRGLTWPRCRRSCRLPLMAAARRVTRRASCDEQRCRAGARHAPGGAPCRTRCQLLTHASHCPSIPSVALVVESIEPARRTHAHCGWLKPAVGPVFHDSQSVLLLKPAANIFWGSRALVMHTVVRSHEALQKHARTCANPQHDTPK